MTVLHDCFQLNHIKFFLSLKGKTSQTTTTTTTLAVCSMQIAFLQEYGCVISGFIARRSLTQKLLQRHNIRRNIGQHLQNFADANLLN